MAGQAAGLGILPRGSVPERTLEQLLLCLPQQGPGRGEDDSYEVESSGFHLEVRAPGSGWPQQTKLEGAAAASLRISPRVLFQKLLFTVLGNFFKYQSRELQIRR